MKRLLMSCFKPVILLSLACLGVVPVVSADDASVLISPHTKIVQNVGDTFDLDLALDSGVVDATFFSVDISWTSTEALELIAAWPNEQWYERGNCPVDTCFGYDLIQSVDSVTIYRIWSLLWESNDCDIAVDGYHSLATLRFVALGGRVVELNMLDQTTIVKGCVEPDSSIVSGVQDGIVYLCPLPPDYTYGGDINGSGDGPDITDLVYLVDFMFGGGPPPAFKTGGEYYPQADVDCSESGPDIADLVYLVDYMFGGGPPPCTLCPE